MKIGVISDTHGHEGAWDKANKFFAGADMIIHAGDVLYHGPRNPMKADYNPAGLVTKINDSKIPVVISRGNCDSSVDESCLDVPICNPYAYVVMGGKNILVTHGDAVMEDAAKDKLAKKMKADIMISGHVHVTVLEKRGDTVFLNPGSAALSKREDGRATCAVIEDAKITIYDIDSAEVLAQLAI